MRPIKLIVLLCVLLSNTALGLSHEVSLAGRWQFIPDNNLSLDQVRNMESAWQQSKWQAPNFGYDANPYWFRIRFKSGEVPEESWVFWIHNGLLSNVQFYVFQQGILTSKQAAGNNIPVSQRSMSYRFPAFAFDVDSNTQVDIYLRVISDSSLQIPAQLITSTEFTERKEQQDAFLGVFLGILVAMMLYNLVLYFSIRETSFLLYVGHCFGLLFFVVSWQGIGPTYIWPNSIWFQNVSIAFATFAVIGFSTWFCGVFLGLSPQNFSLYRVFWVVRNFGFIGCVITFFIPHQWSIYLSSLFSFVAMSMVAKAMWERANMSYRPARLFVFGWALFISGALAMALNKFSFIEVSPASENLLLWGAVLDMVLLCIALGDKFHEERNLKIKAQEMAIRAVEREKEAKEAELEQESLARQALEASVQAQSNYSKLLEKKVLERTQELQSALQELEQISELDPLTGLKNRRYFLDRLLEEMKRSRHQSIPLSILMVDIDHFKSINDNYGHLAGDECIRRVGELLKQQLQRPGDIVCRFGGEEFVVILVNTERSGAMLMAEAMRSRVAQCPIQCGNDRIMLTISVGLNSVACEDIPSQPEGVLSQADEALYRAKAMGRNCVCAV